MDSFYYLYYFSMKVKDFVIKYLYSRLNQAGFQSVVSHKWILWLVEWGLSRIYSISQQGKKKFHSRQIVSEAFPYNETVRRLQTSYPILAVNAFYEWDMPVVNEFCDNCTYCWNQMATGLCVDCWCACWYSCEVRWSHLKFRQLDRVSPGAKLGKNTYSIPAWRNNGWYRGQIIQLAIEQCSCNSVWVEYYAGFNPIKCFDDEINLPFPLYTVLADFVVSDVYDIYGQGKENISNVIYNKWLQLLYSINENDGEANRLEKVEVRQDPSHENTLAKWKLHRWIQS